MNKINDFYHIYQSDTNSPLQPPANPSQTICGSRHVEVVSVDERASSLGGGSPHWLLEVTSAHDNRSFVIVAEFLVLCGCFLSAGS
jgi:hypothetical protein